MRLALLLLCLTALAGCPRQTNETVPVARTTPPAARTSQKPTSVKPGTGQAPAAANSNDPDGSGTKPAGPQIAPPIDYLELGSGFKPAPLPADLVAELPGAQQSADKSELELSEAGETVWLQGFTTRASEAEIGNYYNGLLGVKGFKDLDSKNGLLRKGKKSKTKKKGMRSWRSTDERYDVHVYDTAQTVVPPGQAEPRPIYVVEVHARPDSAKGGTSP
jgi:hypothetical protein